MNYNWFNDYQIYSNEVCIRKVENGWSVFTSDERTSKNSDVFYDSESEAVKDFIKRLRADKVLRNI